MMEGSLEETLLALDRIEAGTLVVVPILFAIIMVVGLVGNSLVVISVKCYPQMCTTTNLFIRNLAIAHLLFVTICVPFTAWDYLFTYWPFGTIGCKIVQCLLVVCVYATIYTLVLMSLDLYLTIAHPISFMALCTVQNANRAILVIWTLCILMCIPTALTHNVMFLDDSQLMSECRFEYELYNFTVHQSVFFLMSFLIPLVAIFILFVLTVKRRWISEKPGRTIRAAESVPNKWKVTRMLLVVVGTFVICWAPIQLVLVLKSFDYYPITPTKLVIQITGNVLAYMNSCVNPILYAILSDNFRMAFWKVIMCNWHSKRSSNSAENRSVEQEQITTVT